jgi:hypothetical protein
MSLWAARIKAKALDDEWLRAEDERRLPFSHPHCGRDFNLERPGTGKVLGAPSGESRVCACQKGLAKSNDGAVMAVTSSDGRDHA